MKNLFAVVEKNSSKAVSIVDNQLSNHFKVTMPIFDILPISNTGVTTIRTEKGSIHCLSIYIDNEKEDVYYIITNYPEKISLEDAYELIK